MLEVIIALAALMFLFAYLYAHSPPSDQVFGLGMRMLMLGVALLTAIALGGVAWMSSVPSSYNTTATFTHDENNTIIGAVLVVSETTPGIADIQNVALTFWTVPVLLFGFVMAFLVIVVFANFFLKALKKDKEEKDV